MHISLHLDKDDIIYQSQSTSYLKRNLLQYKIRTLRLNDTNFKFIKFRYLVILKSI